LLLDTERGGLHRDYLKTIGIDRSAAQAVILLILPVHTDKMI